MYTVENINFDKAFRYKNISMYFCIPLARTPIIILSETEVREFVESVTVEKFVVILELLLILNHHFYNGDLKLNVIPHFECVFSYRVIRYHGRNTD